jgi:hypothetical protein
MPTRVGWVGATFGAITLVIARLFGLLELFIVGSSLIVAPIVAVIIVHRRANVPDIERTTRPRHPAVDQSLTVDVSFHARGRTIPFEVRESYGDGLQAVTLLPALRAGDTRRLTLDVPTPRRGIVEIGPSVLRFMDPLGLARRVLVDDTRTHVIVQPRRNPTTSPHLDDTRGLLIDALKRALIDTTTDREFRGIREYQRGDDVRQVNWKASAKRDALLVNEFDPDSSVVLQIVLDVSGSRHDEETFETAVSIAASLLDSRGPRNARVMLCIGRSVIDDSDRNVGLDRLALAEIDDHSDGGTIAPVDSPDPSAVMARIVVTGHGDRGLTDVLAGFPTRGCANLLITCRPSDSGTPAGWMNLTCHDHAEFDRSWSRFVRAARIDGL